MADRPTSDSSQKHAPLHGISLANFGGNLNFGPTLVPASDSPPISFGSQPTATPSTGIKGNVLACEIPFSVYISGIRQPY